MKTIAVILSGCGVYDGAEINEAVLTLLAVERAGAKPVCYAPDIPQHHVVNHLKGEASGENRSVLEESARIARGAVEPLAALDPASVDGVVFVGGFGAAKNLSSFAFDGPDYGVEPTVEACVRAFREATKPMGFMCIAPVIAAHVLGGEGVKLTIGSDTATAQALEAKGARHQDCPVDGVVVDASLKVVSTPAYMLAETPLQAEAGIARLVEAVLDLA